MAVNLRQFPGLRSVLLRGTSAYWRTRERYLQNFIFIHINKTGGRSVESALGCVYEHKTAIQKREELGSDVWNRKFTFSFVRNPWDRAVSQYFYRKATLQHDGVDADMPFDVWLRRVYVDRDPALINRPVLFLPQSDWVTDHEGNVIVDFIGRFESFEEDFRKICESIGKKALLPHKNRSSRAGYPSYYTPDTADLVARYFAEDIERFGYSF